jgi:hypothetical protein
MSALEGNGRILVKAGFYIVTSGAREFSPENISISDYINMAIM